MLRTTVALFALVTSAASARTYEADFLGVSYHLDKGGSYSNAPRRLDPAGQGVFNPGIGLGVSFRESVRSSGLSPVLKVGLFQDCDDRTVFYGGGGARYFFVLSEYLLVGGGLSLFIANGEDWVSAQRSFVFIPYPSIEIQPVWGQNSALSMSVAFAPGGSSISALSSSDIVFFTLAITILSDGVPETIPK